MRTVVVLALLAACGHDHGPPRVQRLPRPDGSTALRGGGAPRSPRNANYKLEARLDAQRHQIAGTETLTWTNTGGSQVDMLPFHLYLNAFKNESSLFWRSSHGAMRGARAADSGWGWIQVDSLQINGVELASKLRYPGAPDQTVAELPLETPVAPGQTIQISFKFTDQLPEVYARTGYKGDFHLVGQWFPKIGVRVGPPGEEQWACQPMSATTEFFADFGTYDVTLVVPSTHQVAATGVLVSASDSPGNTHTLVYHAEDVHDFAWMADPYMKLYSGTAKVDHDTVEVRVWARPEQADFAARHRDAAIGAIERFSADFAPYPWSIMTVIDPPPDAAAGAGGMEYPTFVTTLGDSVFARPGIRIPEYVTIHEIGHNWFQGLLASNEPEEAWLDEGVNEWADAHVMTELYGPRHGFDWSGWEAELADLVAALGEDRASIPSPIATAAYAFVDVNAYGAQSYSNTQRALATLEQLVGSAKLMAGVRAYAHDWAFKHPTGRDFIAELEKAAGQDLGWYFGPVFDQVGGLALAVRSSSCEPAHPDRGVFGDGADKKVKTEAEAPDSGSWRCEVVVQNTGNVHVPVDVELDFADGSSERRHWDGRGGWQRFEIERSARLVEVKLDPDHVLRLDSPMRHDVRLEGDGGASLRAAARIASWTQTLMQLVGP
ncbi:MAG TPA: M1 family metallopeptidase [Kofleriaceae bacterium]